MEQANITKSIISITSPGTHLVPGNDTLAREIARECNEFAADLKRRLPDKFGFWASLPLPDIEGSLAELAYALEELNADGVAVMTNAHGLYLGDSSLDAVFEELDRRNATIFVHPTSPCVGDGQTVQDAAPLADFYPNPMLEFFFDTARAVSNLFLSGAMAAMPSVTFVIPHAGGALPPLIDRFSNFAAIIGLPSEITPETVRATLRSQFYFDLAGIAFPDQIYGLLRYVNASRIVYGSDFPYTPTQSVIKLGEVMNAALSEAFPTANDQSLVLRDNAARLLAKSGSGGNSSDMLPQRSSSIYRF
jgi:predicted TIM-barrel fold metal-dependent hydrolase